MTEVNQRINKALKNKQTKNSSTVDGAMNLEPEVVWPPPENA